MKEKKLLSKFYHSYIWLFVLVFIADIVTKWAFAMHFNKCEVLSENEMIKIIPNFLYIGLSFNEGMAWSLLAGTGGKIFLTFVSLILGALLTFYYVKTFKKTPTLLKIGLILMIAGAFGNFIDRAFYWDKTVGFTGVIDWIQVYLGNYPFPTFNIADSSLVIGVILFVLYIIIDEVKEAIKKGRSGEYKYSPEELEKQKLDKENETDQNQ